MPTRQHDTEIWKEDWFIDLSPAHRQLFMYIKDQCDCAGIWRVNIKSYERIYKTTIQEDDFLREINLDRVTDKRIVKLDNSRWLLTGFIAFQYGSTLNPKNKAHLGAMRRILENKVPIHLLKGLINPQVIDIKYIAKDKSILTLPLEELDFNKHPDNQLIKEEELLLDNKAPMKGLPSPYEGLKDKDKDKDKEYYSINRNITNVNKDLQLYFFEEKKVQLLYSVPVFQMPEINFSFDGSQFHLEIEKFLKSNFQMFVMNNKIKEPDVLKSLLEEFIKMIQERNEFQMANQILIHFSNWYRKRDSINHSINNNGSSSTPKKEITSNQRRDYTNVNGWGRK